MSSYLVPVYDPNTMQPRPEPTAVLQPISYPQTAANPIYQNQVVYSSPTEQFANATAQYPVGYPMSYGNISLVDNDKNSKAFINF